MLAVTTAAMMRRAEGSPLMNVICVSPDVLV
jgi:hypothetical protein